MPNEKPIVVIAEDRAGERNPMRLLLEHEGFKVQAREGAEAAWDAVKESMQQGHKTALVTDHNMGENMTTGVQLIKRLQENHPDIPAVLVSSSSKAVGVVQDMHNAGAKVDALQKPVDVGQLIRILHDRLNPPEKDWKNRIDRTPGPYKGKA